jgi:hypothetical protein
VAGQVRVVVHGRVQVAIAECNGCRLHLDKTKKHKWGVMMFPFGLDTSRVACVCELEETVDKGDVMSTI